MNPPQGTLPPRVAHNHHHNHPRRPPAHRSVSLRHSPPPKPAVARQPTALSSPNAASDKANPPSSVSPKFSSKQHSSGESSDAGRWFERTNNRAQQSNASYADNDPPFFLRNSSSSSTPPDTSHYGPANPVIPYRPTLMPLGTDGSSTEDFRSVIDDLTVANKKLKQKLKKYEKLHDDHLQEDKLFEVRFHGLPDHKKKELEETLRKFAAALDDGSATTYPETSSYTPVLEKHPTASSSSRFAESGYASMYTSGQNSSTPSNPTSNQDGDRRRMTKAALSRQQQTIQSYLHDIPAGLLPRNNQVPMSDKSKKKMVVRRLEQIFAGKQSSAGIHQQPMQQEEVAQSAASADRQAREATGQEHKPEGQREAHIMPKDAEDPFTADRESLQGLRPSLHVVEHDFAAPCSSPDQRPTRPLDLDPARAQVSAENMEYIRHLGFTPPDMDTGEAPEDGHGWLYLNLLINMAQLHTLNVTHEFVKDALHDYSSHLELSRDGRKIRWKGGRDITRNSGDSSSEHLSGASPNDDTPSSPLKRAKTSTTGAGSESQVDSEQRARSIARAKRQREQNKFAYKPLFFHKDDSDEDEDFYGASPDDSLQQLQPTGNSSGVTSSAMHTSSSKPRREDGPIIFYTKAKFCTDLSGDRLGTSLANLGYYDPITSHPLGAVPDGKPSIQRTSTIGEPRGPLDASPMDIDSNAGSGTVSSSSGLGFSPEHLRNDNDSPAYMDFEASGLGGVQPEDNFSIHVRRSQTSIPAKSMGRRGSRLYPQKILAALNEPVSTETKDKSPRSSPSRVIKEELLSATRKNLPNSTLPPASFLPFDSTSSGDVDSDLDSDVMSDVDSNSESGDGPTTALQLLNISLSSAKSFAGSSSEESEYGDEDEDDDGSIDLLATARKLDPNTVRASEREYDSAQAERLAEEIPAGSSAATAGGGSGFNSPADRVLAAALSHEENSRMQRQSTTSGSTSSRTRSLKRMRTSDSVTMASKSGAGKGMKSRKTEN